MSLAYLILYMVKSIICEINMRTEKLSEKDMREIDVFIEEYRITKDYEKFKKDMKEYEYKGGSWSLYIRWQLDAIN